MSPSFHARSSVVSVSASSSVVSTPRMKFTTRFLPAVSVEPVPKIITGVTLVVLKSWRVPPMTVLIVRLAAEVAARRLPAFQARHGTVFSG